MGNRSKVEMMSNDAKLGLVLGVAIVLVIALVFFRNDTLVAKAPTEQNRSTTVRAHIASGQP